LQERLLVDFAFSCGRISEFIMFCDIGKRSKDRLGNFVAMSALLILLNKA